MITALLWTLIVLRAVNVLAVISLVGKPRKPLTSGMAVGVTISAGVVIAALVYILVNVR